MYPSDSSGMKRPVVHVDSEIEDLIPGYLENRKRDLDLLRLALADGKYEHIRQLAHILKGTGGGYGFDGVTTIATTMELAATKEDTLAIARSVETLALYLDQVEVVYPDKATDRI